MEEGTFLGKVSHYFPHVKAMALTLEADLKVGDNIHIKGNKTDLTQEVQSMQIDRAPVESVPAGQDVGIEVNEDVHVGDSVFKV